MADVSASNTGIQFTDDLAKITNPLVGITFAFVTSTNTLYRCTGVGPAVWESVSWSTSSITGAIDAVEFVIEGGGSTITTGIKGDLEVPFGCTIVRATLLADQTGSIVVDIWKDAYANFPPTGTDSITASAKPTLSSAAKSQDSTLTGWTTLINAGDILRFNVDSVTTITRVTLSLKVSRL